jgi:hypothetical protein
MDVAMDMVTHRVNDRIRESLAAMPSRNRAAAGATAE